MSKARPAYGLWFLGIAFLLGFPFAAHLVITKGFRIDLIRISRPQPFIIQSSLIGGERGPYRKGTLLSFVGGHCLCFSWYGDNLFTASFRGDLDSVQTILEKGVSINSQDELNRTALFFAAQQGHTDLVKLLLDRGADPNIVGTGKGLTPLKVAEAKGFTEIVDLLKPVTGEEWDSDSYEDWEWEEP